MNEFSLLFRARWWLIFPFTEILAIGIAAILINMAYNEFATQHGVGSVLLVAGVGSVLFGWPLLLARVNVFWFDIAYIVVAVVGFIVFVRGEMSVLGLAFSFLAPGMVLAGVSYLIRRLIAFQLERSSKRLVTT